MHYGIEKLEQNMGKCYQIYGIE